MNDTQYFIDIYKPIALKIDKEISSIRSLFASTFPEDDMMRVETARFVLEGGKRFRPSLSYIVARFFGNNDLFPHYALESFHKYLLTHDDIIDRDSMRYGKQTVHTTLGLHSHQDTEHFGNSLGMISGDLMEATTHKIILSSTLPDSIKIRLSTLVVDAIEEVVWGWYDQFLMDYETLDSSLLSEERIKKSIIWVTGRYTVKFPLHYGFAVVGKNVPSGLDEIADDFGVLFQTGDDLIGLFGDPENTGKSNYGDIVQGKKTLPMWYTYQLVGNGDKKTLETLVGKKDLTPEEAKAVREIVIRSGGMDKTKEVMREYASRIVTNLEHVDTDVDLKRFLKGFAQFLETRDK